MRFSVHCQEIFIRSPIGTLYYVISTTSEKTSGFFTRPSLEQVFRGNHRFEFFKRYIFVRVQGVRFSEKRYLPARASHGRRVGGLASLFQCLSSAGEREGGHPAKSLK